MAINIYLAIGEDELEKLTDRWADSRRNAHSQGVYMRPTPFGYAKVSGHLVVNETQAAVVSRTYEMVPVEGVQAAVRYFFEATGLTNDHDKKRPIRVLRAPGTKYLYENPAPTALRRLLSNPTYKGSYELNGSESAVPAIVDPFVWEAAQTETTIRHAKPRDYPLTGILECARCNGPMIGTSAGTPRVQSYVCRNHRRGDCKSRNGINQDPIRQYLLDVLVDNFRNGDEVLIGSESESVDLNDLQRQLERAEASRTAYANDIQLQELLGQVAYVAGARLRLEAVTAAQAAYRQAASKSADTRSVRLPVDVITDLRGSDLADIVSLAFGRITISESLNADRQRVAFRDRIHFLDRED